VWSPAWMSATADRQGWLLYATLSTVSGISILLR
jgi:hypothetical protein